MSIRQGSNIIAGVTKVVNFPIIGEVLTLPASATYIPDGYVPCDGKAYSSASFPELWQNYLTANTPKLQKCTIDEYNTQINRFGYCEKFGVDIGNSFFVVPTIKTTQERYLIKQQLRQDNIWYRLYSDGWCEQGGFYDYGSLVLDWNPVQIYYPITMANTNYTLITQAGRNNLITTSINNQSFVTNRTTTSFTTEVYGDGTSQYLWWEIKGFATVPNLPSLALKTYICLGNGQINKANFDWDAYASALALCANKDLSNSTVPHLIETYSNGTNWYRIWSDGWCEQGGLIEKPTSNYTATVELLVPYQDTNWKYSDCLFLYSASGFAWNVEHEASVLTAKTASTFSRACGNGASYSWQAKGYITL